MIINQTTPIRCDNHHNLLIFCITFEIFSISDIRQDTCYNPSPLLRCASKLAKIQEYAEMAVSAIVQKLLDARRMSIISFQNCLMGTLLLVAVHPAHADIDEGVNAYLEGRYDQAYKELHPLAVHGDPTAQFIVGRMYANGTPVPQSDEEAVRWYRLAAEQGFSPGQHDLASMYFYGYGVEKDLPQAVHWWQKAAQLGHIESQVRLGYIYLKGKDIGPDATKAAEWFLMAAEQGHMDAQQNLGTLYANGKGVSRDYISAFIWWSRARNLGSEKASKNLSILIPLMSDSELTEAERLIQEE